MKGLAFVVGLLLLSIGLKGQQLPSLESVFLKDHRSLAVSENVRTSPLNSAKTARHVPFFCRLENKWEKRSGHGVRFRLGDTYTVDKLEGKVNPVSTGR